MRRILDDTDIRHELGNDEAGVMSQKATTEAISESVKEVPRSIERISAVEKRVSNLELAIIPSPFVTDDTIAYAKAVPANALPYAEVNEIGGMCAVKDGALVSAPVTEVKSVGKNFLDMERFNDVSNWENVPSTISSNYHAFSLGVLPAGTYKLSAVDTGLDLDLYVQAEQEDGSWKEVAFFYQGTYAYNHMRTMTLDKPTPIRLWTWDNSNINLQANLQKFINLQIERGDVETEYEPYKSISLPIPEALRNLEGYGLGAGTVGNTIDFDNKTYVRKVGVVDLGTLRWYYDGWGGVNTFNCYAFAGEVLAVKSSTTNCACAIPFATEGEVWNGANEVFCFNNASLRGRFSEYTDAESFRKAMSGVMLVYELAEPIVEDISDMLPLDNYIKVFEGGVVYAENEHKLDVPSTITYQIKEVGNES